MAEKTSSYDQPELDNETLQQENARLRLVLEEIRSKLTEPAEVIRAIQHGEIDALVVQERGSEQIYSLQRFDSVYRTVVEECFPYGVWLAKPDGQLLYITSSFLELIDTNLEEMREKGQFHFLPPETREKVEREWDRCRETGQICNVEYAIKLGDGSEKIIWTQGLLARTHDGQPHWVGVNIDITERERIRKELHEQTEALRLSEERFRLMADAMPQIVWVTRPDGYHEYYNRQWYDYIGATPEESIGHGWNRPLHPEDRQRAIDRWHQAVTTGEPYEIEYRFRSRDGEYRWFLGRAVPVRGESGQIAQWVGTCTDIEDMKRAEESLREADRRKDEFLAMLAHELRNPLAPIRSGLDILAMDPGNHHMTISLMQEQVQHVVRLVDDLLDVSRIIRGNVDLRKEPVELSGLVERTVEAARPLINGQQQETAVSVPEQPVWLNADPVRLSQVLGNLLNNASKYMDRGGRIEVTAERQGDQAVISVRDTGIGIDRELLPKVFDLFTQSSRSLDRAQGGLGVGLTLVKKLIEMHGGTVSAYSEGLGRGSTFTVRLPVIESPPTTEPSVKLPAVPQRRRILVVDDNVTAARMLSLLLSKLDDHQVETVHDGPAALEKIVETHPEVVLLDIGLPGMDGYEVGRTIRERPEFNDVLLVALTGYGQEEDRRRSQDAGFDEHLVKPPSAEQIKSLLNHPKLRRDGGNS
jgi:PAS domain S-box-containing protein